MKICIAGSSSYPQLKEEWEECKFMLESYYYFKDWQKPYINKELFLLDSGAFTFMNGKTNINWKEYVEQYANFIRNNKIKYFFELDIDSIIGYEKVKQLRKQLEKKTNKKCIPVWHKSRGIEEWKKLTREYDYVAIGGIVTKEIKQSEYKYIPTLLKIAKENNCRVHGLGFTKTRLLDKNRFYSVDSTTWNRGRFGDLYYFKDGQMKIYNKKGQKLKNGLESNRFCLQQWIKYQKYMEEK